MNQLYNGYRTFRIFATAILGQNIAPEHRLKWYKQDADKIAQDAADAGKQTNPAHRSQYIAPQYPPRQAAIADVGGFNVAPPQGPPPGTQSAYGYGQGAAIGPTHPLFLRPPQNNFFPGR